MKYETNNGLLKTFESFIGFNAIFEASTLSKTGMPKAMISAIHQKAEHWDEYERMGHTYRGGSAIPMPYKYFSPSHDIEIGEPKILTGRKTNVDPYSGREIKSSYTDFHWFIESLPFGPNRVVIANEDLEFYMFIYHKSKSKGAPGMQYAILFWDKDKKKAVDFGYSELTTRAVDRSEIRRVHDTKGGNRSDKIQEFVRSITRDGSSTYAPSQSKPLYAYKLNVDVTGKQEPRAIRTGRESAGEPVTSLQLIEVFAERYSEIFPKLKEPVLDKLVNSIESQPGQFPNPPASVNVLAKNLGCDASRLGAYLFTKVKDFRKEIFEEGRGRTSDGISSYAKTSGFELEAENKIAASIPGGYWTSRYSVATKKYSPDEEKKEAEAEAGFREAQPEKYKRELPIPGEYASIKSIIKKHKLDGTLSRLAWFILTDKIKFPTVSVASILGISLGKTDTSITPDTDTEEESWLF